MKNLLRNILYTRTLMQKATEIFNTDIKPISRSVLVVGGAGYIGSHLCKQLDKNGYVPVVVDRNLKKKPVAFGLNDLLRLQCLWRTSLVLRPFLHRPCLPSLRSSCMQNSCKSYEMPSARLPTRSFALTTI